MLGWPCQGSQRSPRETLWPEAAIQRLLVVASPMPAAVARAQGLQGSMVGCPAAPPIDLGLLPWDQNKCSLLLFPSSTKQQPLRASLGATVSGRVLQGWRVGLTSQLEQSPGLSVWWEGREGQRHGAALCLFWLQTSPISTQLVDGTGGCHLCPILRVN